MKEKKRLIVEDCRMVNSNPDFAFRVKKVTNSTRFTVGQYVSARTLDLLLANSNSWTFEITGKK